MISKRTSNILLKISVSLGLISWLLLTQIDIDQIRLHGQRTDWRFLVLMAPLMFLVCIGISVLRWQLILKQQGLQLPFWYLVVVYTRGAFLGSFLPGGITTGDIYRMYSLAKNTGTRSVSIASVLMERALGILALLILSLGALYYAIYKADHEALLPLARPLVFATVVFFSAIAVAVASVRKGYLKKIKSNHSIVVKLKDFNSMMGEYFLSKVFLGKVFLLSVLLQLVIVFWTYAVSQAMNISIPFLVLCISIPLINLFVLLPVSIGGLGVSEAAFVFFLVPFGLQVSEAVTMSLITVQSQTLLYLFSGSFFFGLARMGLLANQN